MLKGSEKDLRSGAASDGQSTLYNSHGYNEVLRYTRGLQERFLDTITDLKGVRTTRQNASAPRFDRKGVRPTLLQEMYYNLMKAGTHWFTTATSCSNNKPIARPDGNRVPQRCLLKLRFRLVEGSCESVSPSPPVHNSEATATTKEKREVHAAVAATRAEGALLPQALG